MATPELTQLRYFQDIYGVIWRVFENEKVQRYSKDSRQWVDSDYTLDELLAHPEIHEVTEDGAS